jgi:hypothetical protein
VDDFPWVLVGVFLLWLFNALGGRKRPPGQERARLPAERTTAPREQRRPNLARSAPDPTQTEGGQLEELLRGLERQLDPTAAEPPAPRPTQTPTPRGPRGRPATVPLPTAEELEERESLESEPVFESLEREVHRPDRVAPDRFGQAEAKERARLAEAEARDREPHRSRHTAFDQRIRATTPAVKPEARRLTTAQIRQAFIWAEILGRPKSGL